MQLRDENTHEAVASIFARGSIENKFYSNELLVKHDENYMPPEIAKDLKMKIPTSTN